MKLSTNKFALLVLDFDPEHHGKHNNEAMTNFLDEILPRLGDGAKVVVNLTGLALLHYKRYGFAKDGYNRFVKSVEDGTIMIGNHSFLHYSFTGEFNSQPPKKLKEILFELEKVDQLCIQEFEQLPKCFRAPYFDINEATRRLLSSRYKYDLNGYIPKDNVYKRPLVENTKNGNYRINTNLILNSKCWEESIAVPTEVDLNKISNFVISVHPYEFHNSCKTSAETMENLNSILEHKPKFLDANDFIVCYEKQNRNTK